MNRRRRRCESRRASPRRSNCHSLVALDRDIVHGARSLADLGSGAGFPGLPLAIAIPQATSYSLKASGARRSGSGGTIGLLGLQATSRWSTNGRRPGREASGEWTSSRARCSALYRSWSNTRRRCCSATASSSRGKGSATPARRRTGSQPRSAWGCSSKRFGGSRPSRPQGTGTSTSTRRLETPPKAFHARLGRAHKRPIGAAR